MAKLNPISPHKLEKIIISLGFKPIRQKGSHIFYLHSDGRHTTIPFHGNREIGPVLLKIILKEIQLERKEYQKYL